MEGIDVVHDVRSDEAWAARLATRVVDVAPVVPVDVPAAVRRGRRRRVARAVVSATGALGVLAVGGLTAQQPLGPDHVTLPAAEVVGFTRAVEEIDGQEQEVATMESDLALAIIEHSTAARRADLERINIGIADAQAVVADLENRLAALGSATDAATEAERSALTDERDAAETRLDALAAQSDAVVAADYASWIAESFGLTDLPSVEVVERVSPADWSARMAECLRTRGGWGVVMSREGGWQAQYDPADADAFGADFYACALMYPTDLP